LLTTDLPRPPQGVSFGEAPQAVDIAAPFTLTQDTTVCLPRPAGLAGELAVYHYQAGSWDALPPAPPRDSLVCGVTTSFSPFVVGALALPQERREQGIAHALGGIARTLGWELTETIRERSRGADGVGSRVKVANLPQSSTQGDDATMTDLLTSGTEIEMTSAPVDRATAPMVRAWARGDKADFNNTPFDGRTQDGEIVSVPFRTEASLSLWGYQARESRH